jgi:hypothetical protein
MRDDRKGVESQIPTRAKRTPELTEKNFRWQNIFSVAVLGVAPPVPNETPAAKFRLTRKTARVVLSVRLRDAI